MTKFPFSYKSFCLGAHSNPVWSHLNLIISAQTLFPNKITFTFKALGPQHIISKDMIQPTKMPKLRAFYSEKIPSLAFPLSFLSKDEVRVLHSKDLDLPSRKIQSTYKSQNKAEGGNCHESHKHSDTKIQRKEINSCWGESSKTFELDLEDCLTFGFSEISKKNLQLRWVRQEYRGEYRGKKAWHVDMFLGVKNPSCVISTNTFHKCSKKRD